MKKQILSLMFCAAVLAANPVFAMEEDGDTHKKLIKMVKEDIPNLKKGEVYSQPHNLTFDRNFGGFDEVYHTGASFINDGCPFDRVQDDTTNTYSQPHNLTFDRSSSGVYTNKQDAHFKFEPDDVHHRIINEDSDGETNSWDKLTKNVNPVRTSTLIIPGLNEFAVYQRLNFLSGNTIIEIEEILNEDTK